MPSRQTDKSKRAGSDPGPPVNPIRQPPWPSSLIDSVFIVKGTNCRSGPMPTLQVDAYRRYSLLNRRLLQHRMQKRCYVRGTALMFEPIAVIQLGQPETLQAAAGKKPPAWKNSPKAASSRNRQHDHGRDPLVLIRLHDPAASHRRNCSENRKRQRHSCKKRQATFPKTIIGFSRTQTAGPAKCRGLR